MHVWVLETASENFAVGLQESLRGHGTVGLNRGFDALMQEFVAIAGAEAQRNAEPDAEKRKYPGGAFDPLGFSKDSKVCKAAIVLSLLLADTTINVDDM